MAIKLYSTDDGHVPAWEYYTIKSGTKVAVGTGMAFDATGKLIASKNPTHICMVSTADPTVATTADMIGPVVRITPDQVWESCLYVRPDSDITPGMILGLSDNGLYIDPDNTTDDVFNVSYVAGQNMNDTVRGRFVK